MKLTQGKITEKRIGTFFFFLFFFTFGGGWGDWYSGDDRKAMPIPKVQPVGGEGEA